MDDATRKTLSEIGKKRAVRQAVDALIKANRKVITKEAARLLPGILLELVQEAKTK